MGRSMKSEKRIKIALALTLFTISILVAVLISNNTSHANELDAEEEIPVVYTFNESVETVGPQAINAASAIVMDMKSGRVLYAKDAFTARPMASTTKIMTALIAIENCDLDEIVTVSKRADAIGGSTIGIQQNKEYKLHDLLYGLMMNSGNDAAIAIAEHVGGDVDTFCKMMTKRAAELGALNTSYKNPHGLDADGHYTTAYDLALITRYALANPIFSEIVSTKQATIPGRSLYNTNEMLGSYAGADGVKTGYTGKAGRCLVTSATRNDMRLISVVLGCPSRYKRAQSSKLILDYAFENYKLRKLAEEGEVMGEVPVYKGKKESVSVRAAETIELPLTEEEFQYLNKHVQLPDQYIAPIYAGSDTGVTVFESQGQVLAQLNMKIWEDVEKKTTLDYFDDIIRCWCSLIRKGYP
jgi:D-alanyl-D-alanine carboxypeptidase (penicillin-binding protein 5/6)